MKDLNAKFWDTLRPGQVIAISMGFYEHFAIVSDNKCSCEKPKLISATRRHSTVREEPYDLVVDGRKVSLVRTQSALPAHQILTNARSQIGVWRYDVLSKNCEAFANWASGLNVSSRQVNSGLSGAAIGLAATKMIAENPRPMAFILAGCVGVMLGVTLTQSPRQGG